MAASMVPLMAATGSADAVAKVVTELIRSREVTPSAPVSAIPAVAGTVEGTKQIRAILRAQNKQAKIAAKAQMVSTLLASPVAMIVLAASGFIATRSALAALKNHHPDESVRLYAQAAYNELPLIENMGFPNLSGAAPGSTPATAAVLAASPALSMAAANPNMASLLPYLSPAYAAATLVK